MVASIGAIASASQGVSYYERDGYYAQDDPAHKEASAWTGKGADELKLSGPVEPEQFKKILEGYVPDGTGHRLGRRQKDGTVLHRPGRDITFSAPKSVSVAALIGGDRRIVTAHDKAVQRTLGWVEKNVAETRLRDSEKGRMVRAGGQKMVAATFRHDTSRNLDPQLHTHAVIANMLQGGDGKWRTMANEKLYRSKMLIGALYRGELAGELEKLGYGIEKTHADGRFEIAGVPRKVIETFSTRRAAIVAAMVAHLSEREAVFSRTNLLTAALTWQPGAVSIQDAVDAVNRLEKNGTLHASNTPVPGDSLTTDKAVADEKETIALMHEGQGRGAMLLRGRAVDKALRNGPLTDGQKAAVKMILSEKDRVIGVQGYAGTGKTIMLNRARALLKKRGYELKGLAPSASAAQTLGAEARIETETLQRFLARNAGVAEGRLTRKGARDMRAAFKRTVLVVDEGSLASTVQARNLLRIARELRLPRVVLVGDGKQLDAVDAGKPFVQLQQAGMKTATMDQIMRQREPELKAAVEASLGGDIKKAFAKLGSNVSEVNPDNLAGAAAARWLRLSPQERKNAGLMAPSHALRVHINEIVRERLIRDGQVKGPGIQTERLVSRGYTHAEKTMAENYAAGDVVAFHRPYKRLGVAKGVRKHILPAFGDSTVDAITVEQVREWFASMSARPGIANRSMPVLSVMMRMAELWGYRTHNTNPCKRIRRFRMKPKERFLAAGEIARLNAVLDRTKRR